MTLYDLKTGQVAWTVSGHDTGRGGLFAESPKKRAKIVIKRMLKKWKGHYK